MPGTDKLGDSTHQWNKTNLVTNRDGSDDYKCTMCGLKAKRFGFSDYLQIKGRASPEKIRYCPNMELLYEVGDEVIVKHCAGDGHKFSNLKRATFHTIVDAPEGERNDNKGVWVMGVGEPVKLLNDEFNFV